MQDCTCSRCRAGNHRDSRVHLRAAAVHSGPAEPGRHKLYRSQQTRPWFQEGFYLLFAADVPGGSSPSDGRDWVPRCLAGQCNLILQLHGCFVFHIGDFGFCWKEKATFIQWVLRMELVCKKQRLKQGTLGEKGSPTGTSLLPRREGSRVPSDQRGPPWGTRRPFLHMLTAEVCKRGPQEGASEAESHLSSYKWSVLGISSQVFHLPFYFLCLKRAFG